jgi:Na+/melibiose symporter-like transporter
VRGVTQLGGPTGAGFLIQLLGAPVSIVVDAVSFVGSAVFVGLIRKREDKPERQPDAHFGREIAEGFNFVVRNRILRSIAMCTGSSNLFSSIAQTMFLVILARELHLGAGFIGVVFSFSAIGGLAGAFTAQRFAKWLGQGRVIWISIAVTGPFALTQPIVQRGWLLVLAIVGSAIYWYGAVVYNINQVSFRQGITPDRLLGRMNATMRFLVWGTLPVGGLIGGLLGQTIGIRETVWVGAIGAMFAFLPVYFSPLRNARELPKGPDEDAGGPAADNLDVIDDGLEGDVKNPQAAIS